MMNRRCVVAASLLLASMISCNGCFAEPSGSDNQASPSDLLLQVRNALIDSESDCRRSSDFPNDEELVALMSSTDPSTIIDVRSDAAADPTWHLVVKIRSQLISVDIETLNGDCSQFTAGAISQ